ncbi:hypothetical protein BH09ACT3_BH09ACT3_08060 [soil metagenome]
MHSTLGDSTIRETLRVFREKGFDATTVEDLAEASGISRATFFRRYGSKVDVLFADHDTLLGGVEDLLARSSGDPHAVICDAAEYALGQLLADPDVARARYALVRTVPSLRNREILSIRRYELLFVQYLRRTVPEGDPDLAAGFAAAVVAVHNAAHREWLSGDSDVSPESLGVRVRRIAARFREPDSNRAAGGHVIAVRFDDGAPRGHVLARLAELLGET